MRVTEQLIKEQLRDEPEEVVELALAAIRCARAGGVEGARIHLAGEIRKRVRAGEVGES